MSKKNKTLREKVYNYLREELSKGKLEPNSYINQDEICEKIKISRSPLRDALIQLESEGFVSIQPRRGVLIKAISAEEIKSTYHILGALESDVIRMVFHRLAAPRCIDKFLALNERLQASLDDGGFVEYYETNIRFHDIFLNMAKNQKLKDIVQPLKQRLYDFPRMQYKQDWEQICLDEHCKFIEALKVKNREAAVAIWYNEHWSYSLHEAYLKRVYRLE